MVVFGDISIAQCTVQKIGIQQRIAFGIYESSRVVLSLLNPEDEIPVFLHVFWGGREFRNGTEIRGTREKIDRGLVKTGGW